MKKYSLLVLVLLLSALFTLPAYANTQDSRGDINRDGIVSAKDALAVLKHAADLETIGEADIEKADVNQDSFIDAIDSLYILKYAAGIIDAFEDIVIVTQEPTGIPENSDTGYEAIDQLNIDYDCFNCFEVELLGSKDEMFTPNDFGGYGITQVYTKGVKKTGEDYLYTLVLVVDDASRQKYAMEGVKTRKKVQSVDYNYYVQDSAILKLNYNELQIEVGETVELCIEDYRYYYKDWNEMKLAVTFNKDITDDDNYTVESLSKYGVVAISKEFGNDTNYEYTINVDGKLQNDRDMVALAHLFSQMEAVEEVSVMVMHMPSETGNIPAENWKCSDLSSVSMALKGGSYDTLVGTNKLDQTAVITGLTPGKAMITVNRSEFGSDATATCIVTVVEPKEIQPSTEYDVVAVEEMSGEDTVKVISTFEEYKEFAQQYEKCAGTNPYSEEFFKENTLLIVGLRFPTCSYFDVTLEKIKNVNDDIEICLNSFAPQMQATAESRWTVFIPMSGKGWDKYNYTFSVEEYFNCDMCSETGVEHAKVYKTRNTSRGDDTIVLSTYEEYLEYFKNINDNIVRADSIWDNDSILGCKEEFFENNSIIVAVHEEISGSIKIECNKMVEEDGTCYIYIDRVKDDNDGAMTDDMVRWEIMIPVEGKNWVDKNIKVAEAGKSIVDVDYDNVRVLSTTYPNLDEPYVPLDPPNIKLISSYAEYKEYITSTKEHLVFVNGAKKIDIYEEEYFNDNVLVVVDYCIGDWATDVDFSAVKYLVDEKKYQIDIEHKSKYYQEPAICHWELIIPVEGKEHTADDFQVNFISESVKLYWYADFSKVNPIDRDYNYEYPMIIDSYWKYLDYMTALKLANPEYVVEKEYSQEDFEDKSLVVGGFWAFSGQLELEYAGAIEREDELTINFDGKCPTVFTEDTYYYHYMISFDKLSIEEENISCKIDVEYY